jgi:hypothetical protein
MTAVQCRLQDLPPWPRDHQDDDGAPHDGRPSDRSRDEKEEIVAVVLVKTKKMKVSWFLVFPIVVTKPLRQGELQNLEAVDLLGQRGAERESVRLTCQAAQRTGTINATARTESKLVLPIGTTHFGCWACFPFDCSVGLLLIRRFFLVWSD